MWQNGDESSPFPPVDEAQGDDLAGDGGQSDNLEAAINGADLAACQRVLRELQANERAFLHSKRFREVRGAVVGLGQQMQRKMYGGMSAGEYVAGSVAAQIEKTTRDRMRAKDQRKVNTSTLRAARLQKLHMLQQEQAECGADALSSVPDGAVETPAELLAAVGAQNSFAQKISRRKTAVVAPNRKGARTIADSATPGKGRLEAGPGDAVDVGKDAAEGDDNTAKLSQERSCYLCKCGFRQLHHFYSQLCPTCARLNWTKRHQGANLRGRVALVTGGRVKIGFHVGLKLLRAGATTIVTSRFPADTAKRYSAEPDFDQWSSRLHCYGLDLRDARALESFCSHVKHRWERLDILINNACRESPYYLQSQLYLLSYSNTDLVHGRFAAETIRRPAAYYSHLIDGERAAIAGKVEDRLQHVLHGYDTWAADQVALSLDDSAPLDTVAPLTAAVHDSAGLSQLHVHTDDSGARVGPAVATCSRQRKGSNTLDISLATTPTGSAAVVSLPKDVYDVNGQQLDTRRHNSWLLQLGEVETVEAAECLAINTLAPFTLCSQLKSLMLAATRAQEGELCGAAFVINVSAMEGKFYRYKTPNHPHTNMAKAALNMMTRTAADGWRKEGIFMNSVDTGWINDENPIEIAARIARPGNAHRDGFQTPIDEIDAAARILDPVWIGVNHQELHYGVFFKDYTLTEW